MTLSMTAGMEEGCARIGPDRVLCADIGGSYVDFAVYERGRGLHARVKAPTPVADLEAFVALLSGMVAPYEDVPLHIAIAGTQDAHGVISVAANIPCIAGTALGPVLSERLGRVVRVANDADCFAMGEAHFGLGRGHANLMGVILGTGAGGALVLDGRLVTGPGAVSGEWGHGPIVPHLPDLPGATPCFPCGCGQRGCLETIASARGLERLHLWSCGEAGRDSRAIVADWEAGDVRAAKTVATYLDYVGGGLAMAVNLTGATILPVGGGLSRATRLIEALDEAVRARILRRCATPIVVPSVLGHEAPLLGAAALS